MCFHCLANGTPCLSVCFHCLAVPLNGAPLSTVRQVVPCRRGRRAERRREIKTTSPQTHCVCQSVSCGWVFSRAVALTRRSSVRLVVGRGPQAGIPDGRPGQRHRAERAAVRGLALLLWTRLHATRSWTGGSIFSRATENGLAFCECFVCTNTYTAKCRPSVLAFGAVHSQLESRAGWQFTCPSADANRDRSLNTQCVPPVEGHTTRGDSGHHV